MTSNFKDVTDFLSLKADRLMP